MEESSLVYELPNFLFFSIDDNYWREEQVEQNYIT